MEQEEDPVTEEDYVLDTLDRRVVEIDPSGVPDTYKVPKGSGFSTFNLYFTSFTATTNFGVPGVTEYSGTLMPVQQIGLPDGTSYQFTYESTGSNKYGLLKTLTLPSGEVVTFTYTNFTDALGKKHRWLNTVNRSGGTWTYTPATCGTNCNKVTVTRPSGDQTVYTFTLDGGGNGAWNTMTKSYTGSAASGTLALTMQRDYDTSLTNPLNGGSGFVRPIRTITTWPGPVGDLVKKTESTFDTFTYSYKGGNYTGSRGNVLTLNDFAYGSGAAGGLVRQQVMTYLHDSNANYIPKNIVNRVTNAQTKNAAGTKIAEMITAYDSTSLTSVTGITNHDDAGFGTGFTLRGGPTVIQRWTGSSYLSTTYNYDTTGQALSTSDPKGTVTQFSYTNNFHGSGTYPPMNAYLTQVTLPASGTLSHKYYYISAKPSSSTDQNGNGTSFSFSDPLGRPTTKTLPGGGFVENQFTSPTQLDHLATANFSDRHTVNLSSRTSKGCVQSDPQGAVCSVTTYDTSGRVLSVTNPYRTTLDPTYGLTSFQYDGLTRVTRLTLQDGNYQEMFYGSGVGAAGGRTTQLCASGTYGLGYPTLSKDETGKKRQSWVDAFGLLIEVDEPDATGALTLGTCYRYDVLGNLTQVDQGSQSRTNTYDALLRLTTAATPEVGTVSYFYTTAGGALCSGNPNAACRVTDARSITTTYTYDAENRLTGKTYSNGDPAVSYFYDQTSYNGLTIANGKGRRTGMSDGSGQTAWSYDAEGHILTARRTIAGITKSISYQYNQTGALSTTTYPSGLVVENRYNDAGRLREVLCFSNPSYPCYGTVFADSVSYAPHGGLASVRIGHDYIAPTFDGMTATYTYNNRLQPGTVTATNGAATLLNLSYNFVQTGNKNNGTVTSITNVLANGRTQNFTYDELNRLATAQSYANSGADCWGQSYTYDRYGNLNTVAVTKCSAPTLSLSINNNNRITNTGFAYDLAGNLTADGFSTYIWTAEDRLASTAGVTYTYDGDNQRVKKSNGKLYWYGLNGEVLAESDLSGNVTAEYIYFSGRRIARRDPASGNIYYFLSDHIGSARVVTKVSGAGVYEGVVEESDFYPFGTERVITDNLDNLYKFTGFERDGESALDHTLYRKYSSSLARWLSPDPQAGSPTNPQSWNRYPYVINNPLALVDPLGARAFDPFLVGCFPGSPSVGFGCGWDEDEPCPPGFVPIYGSPAGTARNSRPAIETLGSVMDYASVRLGPYADAGLLSYELGAEGVSVSMSEELFAAVSAFNPAIAATWPIIVQGGQAIITLLKLATVAVLAMILDEIIITCTLDPNDKPLIFIDTGVVACFYKCSDGVDRTAEVDYPAKCPNPLVLTKTVFKF
jgi:RHS repeat-associated protein